MVLGAVLLSIAVAMPLAAGQDIALYNSAGERLEPAQIDTADYPKTCGGCHEVAENAVSVHFNRNIDPQERNSGECLTCHLSNKPDALTSHVTIRKVLPTPNNNACKACHEESFNANAAHKQMACYDCHRSAGHRASRPADCANCHNGKTQAAKPAHRGFSALHMQKISCEVCHADRGSGKYVIRGGKLSVIGGSQHSVRPANLALGVKRCTDCHSNASAFFPGTILRGNPLGLTHNDLSSGDLRERVVKPLSRWLFLVILALSICHYAFFGPRRVKSTRGEPTILRFTLYERLVHWLTTASFIFLACTGIAFMLHVETPNESWRAIHGQVGGVFTLCLVGLVAIWWKNALFTACDLHWLRRFGGYFWLRGSCPAEKFNAGQKLFFWTFVLGAGALVCATGILLAYEKGAAGSSVFTLHDIAAAIMLSGIIGHVYLSVFANPGSIRGILTGRVTSSWAQKHHPNWFLHIKPAPETSEHTASTLF